MPRPKDWMGTMTLDQGLAEQVATWLSRARWFAGKGRRLDRVSIADVATLGQTGLLLAILEVTSGEERSRYAVPVHAMDGTDAAATPAFAGWLVDSIRQGAATPAPYGRLIGCSVDGGAALPVTAERSIPEVVTLGGDASNTSLVARLPASAFAIKLIRRCEAGPQPEVEVGRFLTGVVGWPRTPALRGWLEYEPSDGSPRSVIATLHDFLPGCQTAWDAFGKILAGDAAGSLPQRCIQMAASLGRVTGEMHAALASRPDVPAFAPEPEHPADRHHAAESMASRVRRVLAHAAQASARFPPIVAARLAAVATAANRIASDCLAVAEVPGGQRIRVHGDYHLGQVLVRDDGEIVVIDFEGEPARSLAERSAKTSPFKDVAGMCRSFDYLVRHASVMTGRPARDTDLATLEDAFLAAYRQQAAGHAWWPADDALADRLLAAWKLDKVVYELAYEIDNRPDWVEVPLGALEDFLARPV